LNYKGGEAVELLRNWIFSVHEGTEARATGGQRKIGSMIAPDFYSFMTTAE